MNVVVAVDNDGMLRILVRVRKQRIWTARRARSLNDKLDCHKVKCRRFGDAHAVWIPLSSLRRPRPPPWIRVAHPSRVRPARRLRSRKRRRRYISRCPVNDVDRLVSKTVRDVAAPPIPVVVKPDRVRISDYRRENHEKHARHNSPHDHKLTPTYTFPRPPNAGAQPPRAARSAACCG